MNILVTGANGFIGRRLTSRLKAGGHHVTALQQDISKPFVLDRSFDLVIHLAAHNITNIGDRDPGLYTAVNVEGTKNLIQAVQAQRWIYLSTAKVYKNEGLRLTEDSPLDPQGAYAQSKMQAEDICRALLKKGSFVILRSVNVIGWGQALKAVMPVFFQKAKAGQPLEIINTPHTPMQFIYVEDVIDAIEAVISHESVNGIFNIAHEDTITLEQLARKIITVAASSSIVNTPKDASDHSFSPVICTKALQQLGWKAKTGIATILELYGKEYAEAL